MFLRASGYTLLEVLIVVAITAILAGIVLPTYNVNSTKAKIAELIPTLDSLMHEVMVQYSEHGTIPTSLEGVSGETLNDSLITGGYGPYIIRNLTTNLHYDDGSTWTNTGALVQLNISKSIGKSIPGFVQSSTGQNGSYNSIVMAFYDDNGVFKIYCGVWNSSSIYIPTDFLPSGCNSTNIEHSVTGN